MRCNDYAPIGDYAIIGNCRTAGLVSRQGSIDWLCLPHFSAPSVFGALLDAQRGGAFVLCPRDVDSIERRYIDGTNILQTTFHCTAGTLRLTDFMCVAGRAADAPVLEPEHELVRIAECTAGEVVLDALYAPRPHYARAVPRIAPRGRLGWACAYRGLILFLTSDLEFGESGKGTLSARVRLTAGERRCAVMSYADNDIAVVNPLGASVDRRLDETTAWWRSWSSRCEYAGPHGDAVVRSALTLKLLTYCLSGAMISAATTSLPESDSGERNWDYRYCWLRDTSLVLQSFLDLGYVRESAAFLDWLLHATRLTWPRLQVLYDVYGEASLPERELAHLEGYCALAPVRVGNGAYGQSQHDVYGEVILTAYDFVVRGGSLGADERRLLAGFGRAVCSLWREPDHGIWEIRLPPRHNTHSKLMCWTALDRLVRLDERMPLGIDCSRFAHERDAIRDDIEAHGYNAELGAYVGYYGGSAPDASLLLLARYGYVEADDPRMIGTYRYIVRKLGVDGLLYRYPPGEAYDGVAGTESLFGICSFWLVDYLARLGELDEAARIFERLLGYSNDLGLYAEELHRETQAPVGNFPQAFTHVGLITAALALEQAREGRRGEEIAK